MKSFFSRNAIATGFCLLAALALSAVCFNHTTLALANSAQQPELSKEEKKRLKEEEKKKKEEEKRLKKEEEQRRKEEAKNSAWNFGAISTGLFIS